MWSDNCLWPEDKKNSELDKPQQKKGKVEIVVQISFGKIETVQAEWAKCHHAKSKGNPFPLIVLTRPSLVCAGDMYDVTYYGQNLWCLWQNKCYSSFSYSLLCHDYLTLHSPTAWIRVQLFLDMILICQSCSDTKCKVLEKWFSEYFTTQK